MEDYDTCELMVGLILKVGIATWHNLVEWSLVVGGVQLSKTRGAEQIFVVHLQEECANKIWGCI